MKYGGKVFFKISWKKKSSKFHQNLEMIHEASFFFFFISLKYLSNNNMKEESLRLRLEKKMFVTTHKL